MPSKRPEVLIVSRAFIQRKNRKLLILQRSDKDRHNPLKWEAPGGKLEEGQDVTSTVEDEVFQEAGIIILMTNRLGFIESYYIHSGPYRGHTYIAAFGTAQWMSGKVRLSHEHCASAWVTYEDLFDYDLTEETRKAATALEEHLK